MILNPALTAPPWLTTLISTLLGPLFILILLLTFGLCILSRLVQFMKERLGTIQLMVAKYQPVATNGTGEVCCPHHQPLLEESERRLMELGEAGRDYGPS